jgi:hypothetical protein
MLHNNTRPCVLLRLCDWEVMNHPHFSYELAPNDFYPFMPLQGKLARMTFATDAEVKRSATSCL